MPTHRRPHWITPLLALALTAVPAAAADPELVAKNTLTLQAPSGPGEPVLDLEVTYLSEPVLQELFASEETRTRVRAAAGSGQAFLVRATARRATEFYPTSFVLSQEKERREPKRSGVIALDGGFGGRLQPSESTRGLVVLSPPLDLSQPVQVAYASSATTVRFASTQPLAGAVSPEGVKVDPLRALEWKVQDLERRIQSLEERSGAR